MGSWEMESGSKCDNMLQTKVKVSKETGGFEIP